MNELIESIINQSLELAIHSNYAWFLLLLFAVLEVVIRVVPTSRNYSLVLILHKLLDKTIGNKVSLGRYAKTNNVSFGHKIKTAQHRPVSIIKPKYN